MHSEIHLALHHDRAAALHAEADADRLADGARQRQPRDLRAGSAGPSWRSACAWPRPPPPPRAP